MLRVFCAFDVQSGSKLIFVVEVRETRTFSAYTKYLCFAMVVLGLVAGRTWLILTGEHTEDFSANFLVGCTDAGHVERRFCGQMFGRDGIVFFLFLS